MIFAQKGPVNTEQTLQLAVQRGRELGIRHYVVASNTGKTAQQLLDLGVSVVCVTHHTGFRSPGEQEMAPEVRQELENKGAKVLTTTHLFGGIDRGVENKFGGTYPGGLVAATLRMLGQGVKVGVEIAVMALDAGLIPTEDIVAIGGTAAGRYSSGYTAGHAKDFLHALKRLFVNLLKSKKYSGKPFAAYTGINLCRFEMGKN